ncbi:MAG: FAD-binding protein [bacterium]|nr:FAD-binding protein [bacterium]
MQEADKITKFKAEISTTLGEDSLIENELMKNHITWRVGGAADLFLIIKREEDLISAVVLARKYGIEHFILGGGANILVGDNGYRGLVIKNQVESLVVLNENSIQDWQDHFTGIAKHVAVHFNYYNNSKDPSFGAKEVFVEVSSGYSMPHFLRDLGKYNLTGLEWFARIPGTLGGWIYNNVHGQSKFIGDFIYSVKVLKESGNIVEIKWEELEFGYDYSVFHKNKDIILSAKMRLYHGNIELSKEVMREVIINKNAHQAANSAGCVFHNISAEDKIKNGFESDSIGYIFDKKLGLLGQHKVGGAWISSKHGNFIETDGSATAKDILSVMEFMKITCREKYNIELQDEIFRIGEF